MTLREGVTWSDRQPFTADDVEFTFDLALMTPAINSSGFDGTVTVTDPTHVVFTWTHPACANAPFVLGKTPILPEHIWKDLDPTTSLNEIPVGTGPYTLGSFKPQAFTLVANPEYWDGEPKVKAIRHLSLSGNTAGADALAAGTIDWQTGPVPDIADVSKNYPGYDAITNDARLKTTRRKQADGNVVDVHSSRRNATNCLKAVRTFHLEIAQWAFDDPARWAPWAAPSPIKDGEIPHRMQAARRKSRMDQRTRERLPASPALVAAVDNARTWAAQRLIAARAARPGVHHRRRPNPAPGGHHPGAGQRPGGGPRRSQPPQPDPRRTPSVLGLGRRETTTATEDHATSHHSSVDPGEGLRVEELTDLTHHSLVQYRVPGSGELMPLLHVAPSKTDTESLLVVSPEIADVLSAIICRVREHIGAIPLVAAYDYHERVFNPLMPLLFSTGSAPRTARSTPPPSASVKPTAESHEERGPAPSSHHIESIPTASTRRIDSVPLFQD